MKEMVQGTLIEGTATERTIDVVAAEINMIKSTTADIINRSVFEIGKRLCEAKAMIGHGNWGAWLAENVNYSETTARSMMRIYQEMGGEQIDLITGEAPIDVFESLNMSQMVALFPLKPEERVAFVKENDVENKSVRQIEELIRQVKDAKELASQEREVSERKAVEAAAAEKEAGRLQRALKEKESQVERLEAEIEKMKIAPVQPSIDELQADEEPEGVENNPWQEQIDALNAQLAEAKKDVEVARAEVAAVKDKAKADVAKAKDMAAKAKDEATAEAKAVFEHKFNPVAQAVNGALRQIGIQIEDIGMSLDEMNKTDRDGARALANKAKAALQAMIENVEW